MISFNVLLFPFQLFCFDDELNNRMYYLIIIVRIKCILRTDIKLIWEMFNCIESTKNDVLSFIDLRWILFIILKKKIFSMPEDRIELSTPGLLDQCSSHWATRAHFLLVLFFMRFSFSHLTERFLKHNKTHQMFFIREKKRSFKIEIY